MPLIGKNLEQCRDFLEKGWILAYPTETCYGLGVNLFNEDAIKNLNLLKTRNQKGSYIILVKDMEMLNKYAEIDKHKQLLEKIWPGPISVILKAKEKLPSWMIDQEGCACFRISSAKFVKELFDYFDRPITSTSANPNNFITAKDHLEVFAYFQNTENILVMNDIYSDTKSNKPSTIINLTKDVPKIVRKGVFNIVF